MQLGIVVPVEQSARVKDAGYDVVEETVPRLLQGEVPDDQWTGAKRAAGCVLPLICANMLVPAHLKITGPDASLDQLGSYIHRVVGRAAQVGMKTLVFGSGAARNVPDGFDRKQAKRQLLEFIRMTTNACMSHGITLVCEPLYRKECNIINTVREAMEYVWEIDHPNFQCLVDTFHFWVDEEPLENLKEAMPWIRHVHLGDRQYRVPPGISGKDDYRPFFAALKEGGYDRALCVETFDYPSLLDDAPRVAEFVRTQWEGA